MKFLVLAMILTVAQATRPVPRQTSNPQTGRSGDIKKDSQSQQKPPPPPAPVTRENSDQGNQEGHQIASTDKQQTIIIRESASMPAKDGWDKASVILTGLLVLIGAFGTGYAIKTLRAVERQAEQMVIQNTKLAESLEIARKTAKAAQDSASAMFSSERAFVTFSFNLEGIRINTLSGGLVRYELYVPVENSGNTIAREVIVHTNVYFSDDPLPDTFPYPDLGDTSPTRLVIAPKSKILSVPLAVDGSIVMAFRNKTKRIYFYGWAEYPDIFFPQTSIHRTEFCYEMVRFESLGDGRDIIGVRFHSEHNNAT